MARLKIAKLGNPILRKVSDPVTREELLKPETQQFIDDMIETMYADDGVGLAAPQVFRSSQIVVLGFDENSRYPGAPAIPLTVLVNPVFLEMSEEMVEGWEGCLSLDNLRGMVPRSLRVRVKAMDREGNDLSFEARDFMARVLQHEIDHLNGIVFIDRMKNFATLTHLKEFETFWVKESTPVA